MSESPLRQQIAEAIHNAECDDADGDGNCQRLLGHLSTADAVVALLNLTEEHSTNWSKPVHRYVTGWLPTPPDTSSSEPA